ncbi:unnamed protein product [Tuber melanosporum]|uniref:(Perigord truffle) hypothetical protein n=1 Tax=Tuber melanosporum (strain Mel28) TaxID=656061 RepID=D5GIJ9_TUBMM|nr:uncharacterized protein GSTUM_00008531001 [Tuber melanosporum]CAZ84342.1 unnamed protein product [Tuber melanosporum]
MAWQIRLRLWSRIPEPYPCEDHGSTDCKIPCFLCKVVIRPTEAHICLRKPTRVRYFVYSTKLWIPFSESIPNGATGLSKRRSYHALIYSSWNPHS